MAGGLNMISWRAHMKYRQLVDGQLLTVMIVTGALLAWGAAPAVWAALPDPTRPAISLDPEPVAAETDAEATATTGLQAVILRKGVPPVAVINGRTVRLGGEVGDARLIKLSESEAILQGPNGNVVLKMVKGVERRVHQPPKPIKSSKKKRTTKNRSKPKSNQSQPSSDELKK